ncbi:MAG: hypothetical protein SGPRY_011429, partial [Prymnesium sp.]
MEAPLVLTFLLLGFQEERFLQPFKDEVYFPSGGVILSDMATANSNPRSIEELLHILAKHSICDPYWQ